MIPVWIIINFSVCLVLYIKIFVVWIKLSIFWHLRFLISNFWCQCYWPCRAPLTIKKLTWQRELVIYGRFCLRFGICRADLVATCENVTTDSMDLSLALANSTHALSAFTKIHMNENLIGRVTKWRNNFHFQKKCSYLYTYFANFSCLGTYVHKNYLGFGNPFLSFWQICWHIFESLHRRIYRTIAETKSF